jgi:hypothetical protein
MIIFGSLLTPFIVKNIFKVVVAVAKMWLDPEIELP